MTLHAPLDAVPLGVMFLATVVIILIAIEVGYRLGRARRHQCAEEERPVGGIVTAELGLLAFLLAFSFGFAVTQYDVRRHALFDEVNAIGTAYLRAEMLEDPHRQEVRQLLRDYADVRITAVEKASFEQGIRRSEELQKKIWAHAMAGIAKDPRSVAAGLFVQAVNDVIDLHTNRVSAAVRSRIPTSVWGVFFAVTVLSFATMGYHTGLARANRSPAVVVVAITFASVIWLVADMDRPSQGLLRISQQPMIDLRNSMTDV